MNSPASNKEATEIERAAKRLTENQRNLLFFWPKGLFDGATMRALMRKGLIQGRSVTPFGKAVIRALIQAEDHP